MKTGELFLGSVVCLCLCVTQGWADRLPLTGRVSAVIGSVQYHSSIGEWGAALANEAVSAGTGLHTGHDAEAELRIPGARVALAPASELQILRSDAEALQIALAGGRLGVHLDAGGVTKTVEIDLPQGGVWLDAPGNYDIAAGDTQAVPQIQVFTGKARLGGEIDDRSIVTAERDWFSDWWRSQDDNADVADGVAEPKVAGAAALDAAGRWEVDTKLGNVWYPSDVALDWAPYRDGSWHFLAPWGWTWIDNAPWGFAPSHYGRWARIGDRWAWVPGATIRGADFSPATVAFLGTPGIGLSRPGNAGPAVAWFPLAPGETVGDGKETGYQNRRFTTAVPRAVFAGGLAVANALIDDVPEQRFADAPVILDSLGIPPGAATVVAAAAPKKPDAVTASPMQPSALVPAPVSARRPFVVALHDAPAPARAPVREVRQIHKQLRVAAIVAARPRPLASTAHWLHNRRRLAATRGGA